MGSKNCAETPRQKMIGMMYLFLTAMLALNVSSEVLNGFVKVDESLRKSAKNFDNRNDATYKDFAFKESLNPDKVVKWREAADNVKALSDSLYNQIQQYKLDIVRDVDGPLGKPDSIGAKDNLDGPTRVMLTGGKNSKGVKLKNSIEEFKEDLISIMNEALKINGGTIDPAIKMSLEQSLSTPPSKGKDGEPKDWEHSYFSEMPTAASIALLSKLQNDVRDAESQVIQFLFKQIDAKDFKVNKIEAHIIPTSTTIIKGGKFSAQILLAGRDTTKEPEYQITENGSAVYPDKKGLIERICERLGINTLKGKVILKDQDGNPVEYEVDEIKYEVIQPMATVSATKMNVLYAGVENPVSISVPGVAASDVKPGIDNGTLVLASDGQTYIAKPKEFSKPANIIVNAMIDGKMQPIAKSPFRVELLPDPLPFIYYEEVSAAADGSINRIPKTMQGGDVEFRMLKSFKGIRAQLPNSFFEVEYKVNSFNILMKHNNGNNRTFLIEGDTFNAETVDFLKEFNGFIYISNIKAVGPDGVTRNLPPIAVNVE